MADLERVALFTNEYPPNVYGGAGVHVEYLSRALARHLSVEVRSFGKQNVIAGQLRVRGYEGWSELQHGTDPRYRGALDALSRSLAAELGERLTQLDADGTQADDANTSTGGQQLEHVIGCHKSLTHRAPGFGHDWACAGSDDDGIGMNLLAVDLQRLRV